MRRKLNVKLVASVVAVLLVASAGVHFLHGFQLQNNAYRLLERGDRARHEKEYDKARLYYSQYMSFVPNDPDTVQKYAEMLDLRAVSTADRVRLILMMEKVLRAKPNEHEFRLRLVHNLIALERISEAMENLKKLKDYGGDKAEVLHMIGWCHDANQKYDQAVLSFAEAIQLDPKRINTSTLLVEVLFDRLNQPDAAEKAANDAVRANPDSYQAYLLRGRFQRRRGDEKSADRDLQRAYELKPDQPEIILELADVARVRGNWTEAVRLLNEGMKRFPNHADFYKDLVGVKIQTEKRDEAIELLQARLKQAPKSHDLAVLLIDLLIDQKQYKEAQAKIDELVKAGVRTTLPNYLKARLHFASKEWNDAIQLLEGVRQELDTRSEWNGRVNALLGLSYRHLGEYDLEMQAFRRAVQDEPAWLTANVGLGMALLNNGRIEEASQVLEPLRTAKDLPAGYWNLLSRSRLYRQMRLPTVERRWDALEESLAQALKSEPKSIDAATLRAEMLAVQGDFAGAKAVLERTRAEHPTDITLTCVLADLAVRQGRFDDAEKILNQAGESIELRLAKCRLWSQRGTSDDRAKLGRVGDIPPNTYTPAQRTRLMRELADAWQRLGDLAQAEKDLREIAQVLPKDLRSRSALLDLALQKNQINSARQWLDELRVIEGEQGWLWRYGAAAILVQEAQGQRGSLDEARKKLQEIEPLHKNWPRVALLSGRISELEGKYPQAIQEYTRALELGETQPRVLTSLLGLLLQGREFGKAEAELAKYEQKLPLTQDLARLGAEVALGMREKQYAKVALRRAEQAVSLPARDYRDALWLARIYQAAGETAKAESLLRSTLDQAGHVPDAWIARMQHLQQTKQREQALKDLERLKKELPPARQPLTIARCYEALHLADLAAKAYQDALASGTDDFILLAHAADFYRRADFDAEAQRWYERLLDPALATPAEYTVAARRHLAILVAPRQPERALALLVENKSGRGETSADARIRLLIQSLTPSAREDALNKFQDSLRRSPPTPDERLLFARMFESADRLPQARTQLSELVDEHPMTPQYLIRYARILIRVNELSEAERLIVRLDTLEPGSERVREVRAALIRAKQK